VPHCLIVVSLFPAFKIPHLKTKYLYITNEIPAFKSPASPDMKKSASVLQAAKRNTSSKNEIPELRPE
jgi:hypothetical protein